MAGGGTHPEGCMPPNLRCFGRQASAKCEVGSAHRSSESGSGVRPSATRMRGPHSGLSKSAALLTALKIRVWSFWNHPHTLSNISES
eukprot:scaffold51224_cov281-Isochrysis_galbana.AAC.1